MQPLVFGLWLRPVGGDTPAGLNLVVLCFGLFKWPGQELNLHHCPFVEAALSI
jgi:hypothetical protein